MFHEKILVWNIPTCAQKFFKVGANLEIPSKAIKSAFLIVCVTIFQVPLKKWKVFKDLGIRFRVDVQKYQFFHTTPLGAPLIRSLFHFIKKLFNVKQQRKKNFPQIKKLANTKTKPRIYRFQVSLFTSIWQVFYKIIPRQTTFFISKKVT